MQFVRGACFDKKEFKRNLAGSGSYPPVYTVANLHKKLSSHTPSMPTIKAKGTTVPFWPLPNFELFINAIEAAFIVAPVG
jgi:hypothetical protein